MKAKRIGAGAAIVGLLALGIRYGLSLSVERWIDSGHDGLAPTIGTTGQTVVAYLELIGIVEPLVTFAVAVGLGYYVGQRVDIVHEYRRVIGAVAAGSTVGAALAVGAYLLASGASAPGDGAALVVLAITFASALVSTALSVTVGALAGAALAHFRATDDAPPRSSGTETGSPPDASDSREGSSQPRTRSMR